MLKRIAFVLPNTRMHMFEFIMNIVANPLFWSAIGGGFAVNWINS